MPRRRESFSARLVVVLCLSASGGGAAGAQKPRTHIDTVLVARDLDGDDRTDRARRAKTLMSHGIDYGEGYFQLRLEGGRAIVDATQEHLVIGGKPVDGTLACADAQLPALRLVFDSRAERFVPEHPRCVKPPGTS